MSAYSHLNVWRRQHAVLYLIRARAPLTGRPIRAYVGKTTQRPWTKRIDQHLWGRGRYHNPAQPWADTVLGYTPGGNVRDVIAAGGVRIIREGHWSPFGLWWREILAIWLLRPRYNYQWNRGNARRITVGRARKQRGYRDVFGVSESGFARELRSLHRYIALVPVALIVVVLLTVPEAPADVMGAIRWMWRNPFELLLLVLCSVSATRVPRRVIRRRRR